MHINYLTMQNGGTAKRFIHFAMTLCIAVLFSSVIATDIAAQVSYPPEVIPLPAADSGDADGGHKEWIPMPTLGGMQFWSDELVFHDWRIQRNVATGHCRLLDGKNLRHGWGTFDQCKTILNEIKRDKKLQPMKGKIVILLHGIFSFRPMMTSISKHLEEKSDYIVIDLAYPSSQRPVAAHAQSLARVIENLHGVEEINFVAHSLGNIVLRHYLGDHTDIARGILPDRRIKHIVMLTPPNHGSRIAMKVTDALPDIIPTLDELGHDWNKIEPKLATPRCSFGIIAGGKRNTTGYNPLLPGDNDGGVTVKSTRLAGATDFVIVPSSHTGMLFNSIAHDYTLRFLRHGYFISAALRNPIPNTGTRLR